MQIHDKTKALRLRNHKTKQEIADMLGVTRATISNFELGRSKPETKKAIIDAFVHSVEITNDKITLTLKVDDTLDKSDRFMFMSNWAVMQLHIYEKSIAESFKNISKHKGSRASS